MFFQHITYIPVEPGGVGGRESLHQTLEGGGGAVVGPHVPLLHAQVGGDWGGGGNSEIIFIYIYIVIYIYLYLY